MSENFYGSSPSVLSPVFTGGSIRDSSFASCFPSLYQKIWIFLFLCCVLPLEIAFSQAPSFSQGKAASTEPGDLFSSAVEAYHAKQYEQAYNLALSLSQKGETKAQTFLAYLYEKGLFVKENGEQAAYWYRKAAQKGNVDAYIGLARLALAEQAGLAIKEVKPFLTKAANLNSNQARLLLSRLYQEGKSMKASPQLAAYWVSEAARHGDIEAQEKLGRFYLNGYGVPQNRIKALQWYEKAAEQGSAQALYSIALLYAEDWELEEANPEKPGFEKNEKKAFTYFKKAAELKYPAAMADLGLMFYQGRGAPRSVEQAGKWFRKAAREKDPEGCYLYAFLLARGEGFPQDFDKAYYWLLQSGQSMNPAYNTDRQKLGRVLEKRLSPERQKALQKMYREGTPYVRVRVQNKTAR